MDAPVSPVTAARAALNAAIADLAALDTRTTGLEDLLALIIDSERATRVLTGLGQTWLHRAVQAGAFTDTGLTCADALSGLLHIDLSDARTRLRRSMLLTEQTTLTGDPLPARMPGTAAALRDGDISLAHASVIDTVLRELSPAVDAQTRARAEEQLADLARQITPATLRRAATRLAGWIDADGALTDPADRRRRRSFRISGPDRHGMYTAVIVCDAEGAATLELVRDTLGKPGVTLDSNGDRAGDSENEVGDSGDGENGNGDGTRADAAGNGKTGDGKSGDGKTGDRTTGGGKTGDGKTGDGEIGDGEIGAEAETVAAAAERVRDPRTAAQRDYDAVFTAITRTLARRDLGTTHRGLPISLILTTTVADLAARAGLALTAGGTALPIADLLTLAGNHPDDLDTWLCITDLNDRPLHLGRSRRTASTDQRLALFATDHGCTFPGCTAPATRTQVHHVTDWAHGGTTDIEYLTYACDRHHRQIHTGPLGWATTIAPPGHRWAGRTLWHPPALADPTREGRVNHHFHPGDLLHDPDPDPREPGSP
ncbi:HNH endonuclease signature motif containing protein [Rhodococcoides corynebacterioides]|uniref:HNH endonuclease signature motif containing protein n=3 Tax=Rhodococcoides corynebacterioides TaxID=53972 RepID=UPI000932F28B|nr:HNH endonuclease signature motif containing protein [Rhodococcus corynebacterioides]